jgi:hypothetical protein
VILVVVSGEHAETQVYTKAGGSEPLDPHEVCTYATCILLELYGTIGWDFFRLRTSRVSARQYEQMIKLLNETISS